MLNNLINHEDYSKNLQINTYSNSLINNLIGQTHLPRTGASLKSYVLAYILNEIVINERKNIIEFGSGISTIFLAKLAFTNKINLQIISVDEDKDWIEKMQEILNAENLQNYVKFIYSPIIPISHKTEQYMWYDDKILEPGCEGIKFDMVIVDGPKAYERGKELIRYHALHFLQNKLNDAHVIFLDDVNRKGEKYIIKKWEPEFNLNFEIDNNLAIAYTGKHYFANPI
jgi:predicted O-methyltransferase YrrM